MTLTQTLMVWGLRAALLWGGAELGFSGYDEAMRESESWTAIRDHAATMERLHVREREITGALAPLQRQLSAGEQPSATLHINGFSRPEDAVSATMKADLVRFGAQGGQAMANLSPLGKALSHAVVDLTWNEQIITAPAVLTGLAAKRPYLTVTRVKYDRIEGAPMVRGEAQVAVNLKIATAP